MALDRNRPVQTRDGLPVRIITWTEGSERYPIIGFIGAENTPDSWTAEGKFLYENHGFADENDLVNVPPQRKVTWHRCRTEDGGYVAGTYDSSDIARTTRLPDTLVGLLKVTWEDGKPVSVELEEV